MTVLQSWGHFHWLYYALSMSSETLMSPSWQLQANTSSIWIHFKPSPPNCRRKKNPQLLTKRDHLEAVVGWWGWRPKRLWGAVGGEGRHRKRERERERERERSSYVYQTMSWVPLCRQDVNYRAQTEKAWLGKKAEILRLLGCRPWALNITATLTSPSYSTGHESRVPDHCNDTQSQIRGSHECRQRHRLVHVRSGRPTQAGLHLTRTTQSLEIGNISYTKAQIKLLGHYV